MPDKTRIYIIGAGGIARAHAKSAATLPGNVELKVADIVSEARQAFKAEFPEAEMFEDAKQMLAEEARENDIVVVATPVADHKPSTMLAFDTGRHVLCEKPLGMNLAEAKEMLAVAKTTA